MYTIGKIFWMDMVIELDETFEIIEYKSLCVLTGSARSWFAWSHWIPW